MHDTWKDMFVMDFPWPKNPPADHCLCVPRCQPQLSGKRELVQLNPFDLLSC